MLPTTYSRTTRAKSFRAREKFLIALVFLTFCFVCFCGLFYLPEFGSNRVLNVYKQFQQAAPQMFIPAPPIDQPNHHHHQHRHNENPGAGRDTALDDDRAKLLAKIKVELGDLNLDRPETANSQGRLEESSLGTRGGGGGAGSDNSQKRAEEHSNLAVTVPAGQMQQHEKPNMPPMPIPNSDDSDVSTKERRNKVREMMIHAWDNYKLYAWGKNELRPLSKRGHTGSVFGMYDFGATIVDGLDTLYLMGLHSRFDEGKDWVQKRFSFENASLDISVFETNIRFVGGFLTLFALTGDTLFKEKAQYVADKLLPAFQTPTGIPMALVNLKNGMSKNYNWASGGSSILSEFGTLHMEFAYLSDITGNPVYRQKVENIRTILKELEKPKGLYPNYLNPKTGKWGQQHMSMGALGDSYFEYLLKAWIQSGQIDEEAREMYDEAMKPIIEHMVRKSPNGLVYISDLKYERLEHKMDHLACFAGGLFALGAHTLPTHPMAQQYMDIGAGVTNTCHESYIRTQTHLGPESFRFSESVEAKALKNQEKYYILRPETFESYFVMWRLTHDQKYRDWGWDAVKALETYSRTPNGYSGVKNVYLEDPIKDDVQQSFFLAETLKYLYLLFSDDDVLPLDQWVFNTEAHPLPVKGANEYYRAAAVSSVAEPPSSELGNN